MSVPDSAASHDESKTTTFASLGLSASVLRALEEIGYESPTPVQAATYGTAIEGVDIIVQARTGTGKTAAFGIPLVDRIVSESPYAQALILAPTRELALQSAREIERLGKYRSIHASAVYGGAAMGPQVQELAEGAQIVSGTPGRVLDHLRRGTLPADRLKVLVLDEMDEMLSMGFARELNAILELIPGVEKRQTMCFSATVDGSVKRHAERHMSNPQLISLSSDAVGAEQVTHTVYMVTGTNRTGDLINILNVEDPESAIVFCNMRSETERVASDLQRAGFNADWLNGDLPQKDRERVMARTREGKLRYLVATDVAARGIDISHLTHVINYSFPESAATYVHRTGRTGRAGRTGHAVSLVSPQELGRLYYLRLEYKITPIERTLPNAGEHKTRLEIDKLNLLEGSIGRPPSTEERALARRLLSHPDAERLVSGLLRAFFGGDDDLALEERATQARRERTTAGVKREDDQRDERERDDSRRERRDRSSRHPERTARWSRGSSEQSERDEASDSAAQAAPDDSRSTKRVRKRRRKRESGGAASPRMASDAADATSLQDESRPALSGETATIFLNVGRRDAIKTEDIVRLMTEAAGLPQDQIGRIHTRDRYTYVDIPEAQLKEALEKLAGALVNDVPVEAERARVRR